jgi:outer membrane receptor protein involved in Fe transport
VFFMPIRTRARFVRGASLVVLAAAMPVLAHAENAEPSAFLESVTVTAQKRVQSQIEVPMALTAYSGEFLQKVNLQELDKLSLFVPGFEVQNQSPNNPGLVMRGLNLDSGEAAQEPRVSVFEDDVSISTTRATYIELFDIERVEVARGPQTTLFGRSALMGGVNIIQNKAKLDGVAAGGSIEFGDYGYRMMDGFVNMPLSDTVAIRAAARYKARDGYVDDLNNPNRAYNSVDTFAGRLSLAWKPNENFSADLIANFEQDRPTGTAFKSGTFLPTNDAGTVIGDLGRTTGAALTDSVAGFEGGKKIGLNRRVWDVKALTGYKLSDDFSINNVTAYRRFDSLEVFDPDGFEKPLLMAAEDERGDQFSHETRLNYDGGGRLTAFAGINYFYSNVSQRVPMQADENALLALVTWGQGGPKAATAFNLLQTGADSTFASAMQAAAPGMLADLLYPSVYAQGYSTAYTQVSQAVYNSVYSSLVGTYGPAIAAAQANAYINSTAGIATINGSVTTVLSSAALNLGKQVAPALKSNHWEQATNYGKTKSVDFYADATYKIIDALELNAGVRYTRDDKQTAYASTLGDSSYLGSLLQGKIGVAGYGLLTQPTANNGDKIARNFSDDGLSWRFSLRYAVADNTSLYATYARGRRPKVLSAKSPSTPLADPRFQESPAETVDSYEIGAKTAVFDNTLRVDTTFYFYDYTNFQSTKIVNQQYVSFNAGKAEAYGFEGTLDWALADWADVFGTVSVSRARFVGDSVFKGNQFRLNPDGKFSLGASLRYAALGGTFNFLPTYTWQSKIFFDDNNDRPGLQTTAAGNLIADTRQDEYQNAYGLLNLRLSYQPDNAPWSASVFVSNVLDKKFIKDAGNSGDNLGIPTFIAGEPRFFGGSISFKTH